MSAGAGSKMRGRKSGSARLAARIPNDARLGTSAGLTNASAISRNTNEAAGGTIVAFFFVICFMIYNNLLLKKVFILIFT
jgi:hypothetical protein